MLLFAAAFALFSFLVMRDVEQTVLGSVRRTTKVAQSSEPASRKSHLADGCYHVFVDVGANIGVHGRFLLEPEKYNETKFAGKIFDEEFGSQRHNRDFCVFAFEPNPAHRKRLDLLEAAYKAMGWRYEFIPSGVGDQDGNLTFYHLHDERHMEWGFTTVRQVDPMGFPGQEEHVDVIRLASWLQDEVRDRVIPSVTYGEYESGPKVVMKLDVEGLEFVVLPDLLVSGALCNTVDFVFGEFHFQDFFYPLKFPEHNLVLNNSSEARQLANDALKMMEISPSCKTRYDARDDETYLKDGMSLPEPS